MRSDKKPYKEVFQSTEVLFGQTVWYFLTCSLCPKGRIFSTIRNPRGRRVSCYNHTFNHHPDRVRELFPEFRLHEHDWG